jgi:predicted nucleic acid binding AN1-type Zn finger protein
MKCDHCKKKLKLSEQIKCKCAGIFCSRHRFTGDHNCGFDFKAERKEALTKELKKHFRKLEEI